MFEQLEDDDFVSMYMERGKKRGSQHKAVDVAIIPFSVKEIEEKSSVIFSRVVEDGITIDRAVVGFNGRESFLLVSENALQINPVVSIQCSTLLSKEKHIAIVIFIVETLGITLDELLWVSADIKIGE